MVNNNRVFYAIEQLAIKANSAAATGSVAPLNSRHFSTGALVSGINEVNGLWEVPRGLQSAGMSTTFNLEQVFQIGQVELYEYSERQPDVEITLSKAIDGTKPLFLMCTDAAGANNLIARANNHQVDITFQIYPDTQFRATSRPQSVATLSGMFLSSISYTFGADGFVTEDATLIGNDKTWGTFIRVSGITQGDGGDRPVLDMGDVSDNPGQQPSAPEGVPSGVFGHDGITSALVEGGAAELAGGTDRFGVIINGSGIQRREEVEIRRSILPVDIPGITAAVSSGINAAYVNGGLGAQGPGTLSASDQLVVDANTDNIVEHIQSITVSADLTRDDIFRLGQKRPFARVLSFPIEVTTSIEVITAQGDMVDASSAIDCGADNTSESNTVVIRTCDGLQIDLGDTNRLTDVAVAGGDAGGDNLTVTYNYTSFNTFNVSHDFFQPNHRLLVFETGNSRFNVGGQSFLKEDVIG
jgi:hypothetical protein